MKWMSLNAWQKAWNYKAEIGTITNDKHAQKTLLFTWRASFFIYPTFIDNHTNQSTCNNIFGGAT